MPGPYQQLKFTDLNRDIEQSEIGLTVLTDLNNMRYVRNGYRRVEGDRILGAAGQLFAPLFLHPIETFSGDVQIIYANETAVGIMHQFNLHTDITPLTGVTASLLENWTGTQISNIPVLSSPLTDPIYWDGVLTNPMQVLPGWPADTKAQVVRNHLNFLVALDLTEAGVRFRDRIRWSASAQFGNIPNSWDFSDPALDAGQQDIGGIQGGFVDAVSLFDDLICYKQTSTFVLSPTGDNQIFAVRLLFPDIGIYNVNCCQTWRGQHVLLTQDDLIVHDGRQPSSVINNRMRKWLFDNINRAGRRNTYLVHYTKLNEIWTCFADLASQSPWIPNKALVWNYVDNKLSIRDLSNAVFIAETRIAQLLDTDIWDLDEEVWDLDETVWDDDQSGSNPAQELVMASGSNLWQIDVTNEFITNPVAGFVERQSMPLSEDLTAVKLVRALWPTIRATVGTIVLIRVGGQMHPDDPIDWGPENQYTVGTDDRFNTFVKGRLLSFSIRSETGEPWKLEGMLIEATPTGSVY